MKVLVTGGTGFVGPAVVQAIAAAGHDVRALVREPERGSKAAALGAELVQGDMTDAASLRIAAQGVDAVVHLVAIRQGRAEEFQRVMVDGTRHLLAAAKEGGASRFVQMSALGTTEDTKDLVPYYGAKWQQELDVKASGLDHVIFRPSFVFGRDGGLLAALVRLNRYSPVTPVVSTRRLQPIWVEDVAAFFAGSLELGAKATGIWELGGPDVVSWAELNERIRRTLGKRRLAFRLPTGVLMAGAAVGEALPPFRGARAAVRMLEHSDNVTDIAPAVETFGVKPITLEEQLRRAV